MAKLTRQLVYPGIFYGWEICFIGADRRLHRQDGTIVSDIPNVLYFHCPWTNSKDHYGYGVIIVDTSGNLYRVGSNYPQLSNKLSGYSGIVYAVNNQNGSILALDKNGVAYWNGTKINVSEKVAYISMAERSHFLITNSGKLYHVTGTTPTDSGYTGCIEAQGEAQNSSTYYIIDENANLYHVRTGQYGGAPQSKTQISALNGKALHIWEWSGGDITSGKTLVSTLYNEIYYVEGTSATKINISDVNPYSGAYENYNQNVENFVFCTNTGKVYTTNGASASQITVKGNILVGNNTIFVGEEDKEVTFTNQANITYYLKQTFKNNPSSDGKSNVVNYVPSNFYFLTKFIFNCIL